MMTLLAAACAGGAVLAIAHRPAPPERLRGAPTGPTPQRVGAVIESVGRRCRQAVGLRSRPDLDRRVGAGALMVVVALAAGPELAAALTTGAVVRGRWARVRADRGPDLAQVERDLPDLVDLLALAVGAGLSVPAALPVVAPVAPAGLRDELRAAVDAIAGGRPSDEAIAGLASCWGAPGRPLAHALADHLRYGTPALPALERVAAEARTRRRRGAETRARKLPVLLLFPLVLCTLPAFGLLTVAPLVAGTFDSLSGGQLEAPASLGP